MCCANTVLPLLKGASQRIIVGGTRTTSRKKEFFCEKKRSGTLALFLIGAYSAGVRPATIHACHGRIFVWPLRNRTRTLCPSQPYHQSELSWRARHGRHRHHLRHFLGTHRLLCQPHLQQLDPPILPRCWPLTAVSQQYTVYQCEEQASYPLPSR